MPGLEINTSPDFFKDFQLEVDGDIPDALKDTATTDVVDTPKKDDIIPEGSLDDLVKELEGKGDGNPDDTKVEGDTKVDDNADEPISIKPFLDVMLESKILEVPEGVDLEDSPEGLVEAFQHTINTKVEDGINGYKESIPELGKQFLDYIEKGGDPKRFIEAQADPLDLSVLDLSNEGDQKAVIEEYLATQGYEPDEIKETLQDYEDGMLLEKQSKLAAKKLEKIYDAERQNLQAEQDRVVKEREKQVNEYISSVETTINGSTEIAGLAISDKDKKEFQSYLLKRDKDGLTQYQKDVNQDPLNTQIKLAYLAFKKYDFSGVAKQAESSAAKKFRDAIAAKQESTVKGMSQDPKLDSSDNLKGFNRFRFNKNN